MRKYRNNNKSKLPESIQLAILSELSVLTMYNTYIYNTVYIQ